MVMMTVETPITVERLKGKNVSASASISAKLCEAEAEARNPESVTPIWMVERNRLEFFVSFKTFAARLSPSSAIFRILLSLSVIMAISEEAKKALRKMSRMSRRIESRRFVPSPDAAEVVWLRRVCSMRHILPSGSDDIWCSPFKNYCCGIHALKRREKAGKPQPIWMMPLYRNCHRNVKSVRSFLKQYERIRRRARVLNGHKPFYPPTFVRESRFWSSDRKR